MLIARGMLVDDENKSVREVQFNNHKLTGDEYLILLLEWKTRELKNAIPSYTLCTKRCVENGGAAFAFGRFCVT